MYEMVAEHHPQSNHQTAPGRKGLAKAQSQPNVVYIIAGFRDDQWPCGFDLSDDDQYWLGENLTDNPHESSQWRCYTDQKAKERNAQEITQETKYETYLGVISPRKIKVATDADVCLANTQIALYTNRWTEFKN